MSQLTLPDDFQLTHKRTGETYADGSISKLMERFDIPPDLRLQLIKRLDRAIHHYSLVEDARSDRVPFKERRQKLTELAIAAETLETLLTDNGNVNAREIALAFDELKLGLIQEGAQNSLVSIGAASPLPPEDGEGWQFLDLADALAGIRLIQLVAKGAIEYLPEARKGRPKNAALKFWLQEMCEFWERDLGRKVTHQEHKGEGLTQTAEFMKAVLAPFAPHEIPSLASALGQARTERNRLKKMHSQK